MYKIMCPLPGKTETAHCPILFPCMALALAAFICAACGTKPSAVPANGLSLDEGIARLADTIDQSLPPGTRIAAVNFESPSAYFSDYVLEELQTMLVNKGKLVVVDRKNLELVRSELNFQMSGDVSDETAVSIGHWLGAQSIVTGSFTDLGGSYRFRFSAINIETAVRQSAAAVTVGNDTTIAYMVPARSALPAGIPSRPDPQLAIAYFNSGFAHYEAGRYKEAVADFTRALENRAEDAAVLRYRAYSYYYLEEYDKAISDATGWIQLEPNSAEAYVARSAAYLAKNIPDRVIADCNQAITLNPNLFQAYNNRGNAYSDKGDSERAIADYNQAIRLNLNNSTAYFNRANVYSDKGDSERAIADYTRAIRVNPNFAAAYSNRGLVYAGEGDPDRAIADYNQAIRLNPHLFQAYNSRGVAYRDKGDYARARADWEAALRINPQFFHAQNNLDALRQQGY